ncbi:MAG TPA: rhodanese-like domain-containing protein [Anaerolineales bacterium]|nr:rhodanese-like domain-containing protein [Anaerolineales bacterium]HNA87788.1 rhodanese-like domain-containing protein [Anaerolineales bacterium]HNB36128.1 rhodanese-like domain-containing protein [Anaerolineales bacterium]HNC07262.1 rhodanese-like domain-containing protein [Anaerolineales bacterium]
MKKILFILTISFIIAACGSSSEKLVPSPMPEGGQSYPNPTENQAQSYPNPTGVLTEADVPRIKVEDAKAALDSGQAILIDVRSTDAYADSHAAGAISISLDKFENNIANLSLDKEQWIITYCT